MEPPRRSLAQPLTRSPARIVLSSPPVARARCALTTGAYRRRLILDGQGEGRGGMRRILIGFLVATTLLLPACKRKTEGGNVVQLGADDPGLVAAAAEAKRRWPEFVAAFNERRPGRKYAVKYAARSEERRVGKEGRA